jgi:hypothetical protein
LFTVPQTGLYYIGATIQFSQNTNNGQRQLAFVISPSPGPGTNIGFCTNQPPSSASATVFNTVSYSQTVPLSSGDVIAVEFKGLNGTGITTVQTGSRLTIIRLA